MKKRKKVCLTLAGLFILVFVILIFKYKQSEVILMDIKDESIFYSLGLNNDDYIYSTIEDDILTIEKYNISSGNTSIIGEIDNFYLSTKNVVNINNTLYFYAGIADESSAVAENKLFAVNLKNNSIEEYSNSDNSVVGIITIQFGNNIATFKNIVEENIITSFVEVFHTSTKEFTKHEINIYDSTANSGSAIYGAYGDNEYLYVLKDVYVDGVVTTYIETYDIEMNKINELIVDDIVKGLVFNSRIVEMAIWGNITYFRNINGGVFIGQIENNKINPILTDQNIELALSNEPFSFPVFFSRSDNKVFGVNTETGEISVYEPIIENYSINYLIGDNNNYIIQYNSNITSDSLYYFYGEFKLN